MLGFGCPGTTAVLAGWVERFARPNIWASRRDVGSREELDPTYAFGGRLLRGADCRCVPENLRLREARTGVRDRLPHPVRRARRVDVHDAEHGERVDDGVDARRQRADGAGFAGAFYTERVGRRRHRIVLDHHGAEVIRPRHGVIHERAGEHLAGLVIGFVLHQHLAHAWAMPPMIWPLTSIGLMTVPTSSTTQ